MRKPFFFSLFLSVSIVSVFYLAPATAQERKGIISGRVTDSTHAVLQGARVELQPKGPSVVSDSQGQFTIGGLTPGHYTLTVTAVGFAPFSTSDLAVTAGGVAWTRCFRSRREPMSWKSVQIGNAERSRH